MVVVIYGTVPDSFGTQNEHGNFKRNISANNVVRQEDTHLTIVDTLKYTPMINIFIFTYTSNNDN